MTTPAKRRLVKDFKRLQKDPPAGVSAAPAAEDIMKVQILSHFSLSFLSFLSHF